MKDLISRKKAIEILNEAQVEYDEYYKGLGKAKSLIDDLPTEDPHPHGKWIRRPTLDYVCSHCNKGYCDDGRDKFCNECGCAMD